MIWPTLFIDSKVTHSNGGNVEEIKDQIFHAVIYIGSGVSFCMLLGLILFRGKPSIPPRYSEIYILYIYIVNQLKVQIIELGVYLQI